MPSSRGDDFLRAQTIMHVDSGAPFRPSLNIWPERERERNAEYTCTVRDILMPLLRAEFNLGEVCRKKVLLACVYRSY